MKLGDPGDVLSSRGCDQLIGVRSQQSVAQISKGGCRNNATESFYRGRAADVLWSGQPGQFADRTDCDLHGANIEPAASVDSPSKTRLMAEVSSLLFSSRMTASESCDTHGRFTSTSHQLGRLENEFNDPRSPAVRAAADCWDSRRSV